MRYPVVIIPEEVGGFSVLVPSLAGCHSQGETLDEALENVKEAIQLYVEALEEDGLPVPTCWSLVH